MDVGEFIQAASEVGRFGCLLSPDWGLAAALGSWYLVFLGVFAARRLPGALLKGSLCVHHPAPPRSLGFSLQCSA